MRLRGLQPKIRTTDRFKEFQKRYAYNPAGFVVDCFEHDKGPTPYQLEALEQLPIETRVSIRGPHGLGKTAMAAWVVLWGVLTANDCKVPTTASAWRQLTHYLWPEVHKWAAKLKWDRIGRDPFSRYELLTRSIKRGAACEAFAVASDDPTLIEGAHAKRIVYIYDEAKSIRDETFDASEGAFSQAGAGDYEAYALAISTPGEPMGRFFDIHRKKAGLESWWTRHVTLEEAIEARQIGREWAEEKARLWGIESAIYQNRVLGEFAAGDTDGVIPLAWVEKAHERWHEWNEAGRPGDFTGIGVDVGSGKVHANLSVIARCYDGCKFDKLEEFYPGDPNTATMELAGKIKGIVEGRGGVAVVDSIGIGAGTLHRLHEQGLGEIVYGFVAGQKTDWRDRSQELAFADCRSAGWWLMREMLDPMNGEGVALPPTVDDILDAELTTPTYKMTSGGKIRVESKDQIKKRLSGRSTDHADAIMHIMARELVEYLSPFMGFI